VGYLFWISGVVAASAVVIGVSRGDFDRLDQGAGAVEQTAYARSDIGEPEFFVVQTSGSALATAAFGMSALQPATYDSDMVLDIINASHLSETEKFQFSRSLQSAEKGRTDLAVVLAEIRVALAIE